MDARRLSAVVCIGLSAALLVPACGPSAPPEGPAAPSATPTAEPAPVACASAEISEANLAADARIRALVSDRRKAGVIPIKLEVVDCQLKLEVLDDCNSPDIYDYKPHAGNHKTIVHNAADLGAELPLGGASLSHKLGPETAVEDLE